MGSGLPRRPGWCGNFRNMTRRVMKLLLVVCLIWALTPGLAPAVENLWHLVATGHTAHALDQGSDHAPLGDEHGCTGTFHLCTCHHTPVSELVPMVVDAGLLPSVGRLAADRDLARLEPVLRGLERPPRC